MKRTPFATLALPLAGCLFVAIHSPAAVHYVDVNSTDPTPPYTSWITAARNIQDAVGAAVASDVITVTNGVYAGRVNVTNPLALVSVNGPQFTIIDGGGANQCVELLPDGASLTGFTLTNGMGFGSGGGVYCASTNAFLTNCVITGNYAAGLARPYFPLVGEGGGVYGGTLYGCVLDGNEADGTWNASHTSYLYGQGGGAAGAVLHDCILTNNYADGSAGGAGDCTLYHCTLTGNQARLGGGTYGGTLHNCTLSGNVAGDYYRPGYPQPGGGGAYDSELYNCTLSNNYAAITCGGGALGATLHNCTLIGNSADEGGGGAWGGTLHNCALSGNATTYSGGGTAGSTLYNCTLVGNSAGVGGGAGSSALYNSIAYFNSATNGANYDTNSVLDYCCTAPLPTNGIGNIDLNPLFVDYANGNLRLQSNSPCINTGNNDYVTNSTDLDGNPRIAAGTVDMGAYECQPSISGGQFGGTAYSPGAGFSFAFSGATIGQPYRIQTSSSLAADSWTVLTNFIYTGPVIITNASSGSTTRFYRAVSP